MTSIAASLIDLPAFAFDGRAIVRACGNYLYPSAGRDPAPTVLIEKYDDRNRNGLPDPGAGALGGRQFRIERIASKYGDQNPGVVATVGIDGGGTVRYAFNGAGPGTYAVEEVGQDGWAPVRSGTTSRRCSPTLPPPSAPTSWFAGSGSGPTRRESTGTAIDPERLRQRYADLVGELPVGGFAPPSDDRWSADTIAAHVAPPSEAVTVAEMIAGYRQLIARAHEAGLTIFGATMTPFENTTIPGYYTAVNEAKRLAVNRWIRTSGEWDGVLDFDRAVRDPDHPLRMLPAYDSGDHLHPNDAGMRAMADAIPLRRFQPLSGPSASTQVTGNARAKRTTKARTRRRRLEIR